MPRFQDKRVFVTGSGLGIGFAACRAFAREGATVGLNDIRADLAESAAQRINGEFGKNLVVPFPGDIADVPTIYELLDGFSRQYGAPDIVVANAGITNYVEFIHCDPAEFTRVTDVNLRGTYFTAQAAARQMIAHGVSGRIILVSSAVGLRVFPNFSVYSMTKAALQMLAQSLAVELGPYGITVNSVSPGATLTERAQREDPDYAAHWATVNVTGRVGTVEDVAESILFLASREASQITGHNLVVDGGWSLRSPIPAGHPDLPVQHGDNRI